MQPTCEVVSVTDPEWRSRCREFLLKGDVVALPTDTYYCLAVRSRSPRALAGLNALKGKSEDQPLLMLAADRRQAAGLIDLPVDLLESLADRFWPGPLTLIGRRQSGWPAVIGGGRTTVAVRVPGADIPRTVATDLGEPISGISANRHGQAAPLAPEQIDLAGISLIVDGGRCPGGAPSTLLDLTCRPPRILREGPIPQEEIETLLGPLAP